MNSNFVLKFHTLSMNGKKIESKYEINIESKYSINIENK